MEFTDPMADGGAGGFIDYVASKGRATVLLIPRSGSVPVYLTLIVRTLGVATTSLPRWLTPLWDDASLTMLQKGRSCWPS
jgi:hypothetical protein